MRDFATPVGSFWLHTQGHAITALASAPPGEPADPGLTAQVAQWLQRYFSGTAPSLEDLPSLQPSGTPFQQRVWEALRAIPAGQVITYGMLAQRIGSAPRAVGGALAANPIPILLPCHRVVAANGDLRGYSGLGGMKSKQFLLELEGIATIEKKEGVWGILPPDPFFQ
ncbi:MAG: methylated-DNA--[protein]-cysteine S-methyltransferase [Magnetococcales bacterium]|nr:methylated-DNA--[protein]-cysteine S-methyltransferase [Magnetococcales bacterium]